MDVGCSIGLSLISDQIADAAKALAQADIACHLAKRSGRNRVRVFDSADVANVNTMTLDMGWSRRIKDALKRDRFVLAYQPIINIRTQVIERYEVLLRLRQDDGGLILPGGFLASAERFGLASEIDKWVVARAIDAMVKQGAGGRGLRFSINLSGQSLSDGGVYDLIHRQIAESGIDPSLLVFEVTETSAIVDLSAAEALLSRLRAMGCETALDDFGAGMSSFAYLKELPVDYVKIDGRFVKNITADAVDLSMVKAMNDIARTLGKQTVAEFVENEACFRLLAQIGVGYGQGDYWGGKPQTGFLLPVTAVRLQVGRSAPPLKRRAAVPRYVWHVPRATPSQELRPRVRQPS